MRYYSIIGDTVPSRGVDVTPSSGGVEVIPLFVSDDTCTSIDNEVVIYR